MITNNPRARILFGTAAVAAFLSSPAAAQLNIPWWTADGGGGLSSGGGLTVEGTIGQADAAASGSGLNVACGYWTAGNPPCYANCDGSTSSPVLTANDFQCFLNQFAAGLPYANCDASTANPVLTANDFQCFLNAFAAGCT